MDLKNPFKYVMGHTTKGENELKYRFANVRGEKSDPEESDYVVNLPSPVFGDLGLEKEAKDEVYLELIDEGELTYIRGRKTEEDEGGKPIEGYLDMRQDGSLAIPNWADDFLPHPLYQVALEINLIEGHFRIYSPIEYCQKRVPELRKQGVNIQQSERVIAPLALTPGFLDDADNERIECLTPWTFPNGRFRFIMYDAHHPVFRRKTSSTVDEYYKPMPSVRQEVVENDTLPRHPVEELRIEWKSNSEARSSYQVYSYSGEPIEELDIVLPEKGLYTIVTQTEKGEHSTWLQYGGGMLPPKEGGWAGTCLEIPEDREYSIAYIPCQTIPDSKKDPFDLY